MIDNPKRETWCAPGHSPGDDPACYSYDVALMLPVPMNVTAAWDTLAAILKPHGIVLRVMGPSGLTGPGPSMGLGEMTPERWAELSKVQLSSEPFEGFVKHEDGSAA